MTADRSDNSIPPHDAGTPDSSGLRLVVIGPGRAGGSIALASAAAGHRIVGVLSRSGTGRYGPNLKWGEPLPPADVALICVKDGVIGEVVARLDGLVGSVGVIAHVSGFVPTEVLAPLRAQGPAVGGFHPLQSLPDPERGSRALASAHVGVGGDASAVDRLMTLGSSLGMIPFQLDDAARPSYHAAAAATSNFVVTALAIASDLYRSAGIDATVARPLAETVVANVFENGADSALTGPISRGDLETVRGHLLAARRVSDSLGEQFRLVAEATAIRAGRRGDIDEWK